MTTLFNAVTMVAWRGAEYGAVLVIDLHSPALRPLTKLGKQLG